MGGLLLPGASQKAEAGTFQTALPFPGGPAPTTCCPQSVGTECLPCHWPPLTFLAMMRPEGLCWTLVTTPPFPAPSSEILSKSSSVSSPTLAVGVRKASSRFFCCSSSSSSSSFFWRSTKFALQRPQGQGLVKSVRTAEMTQPELRVPCGH